MKISKGLILAIFAIGAGLLGFSLWHGQSVRHARRWPTTEAIVTSSQVTSVSNLTQGKLGTRVVRWDDLAFSFTYRISGRDYVSKRFYLVGHPPAHIVAHDFPVGRKFLASYDTAAHAMAVVEPGPFYHRLLIVALICLGLVGAGIIYNCRWT